MCVSGQRVCSVLAIDVRLFLFLSFSRIASPFLSATNDISSLLYVVITHTHNTHTLTYKSMLTTHNIPVGIHAWSSWSLFNADPTGYMSAPLTLRAPHARVWRNSTHARWSIFINTQRACCLSSHLLNTSVESCQSDSINVCERVFTCRLSLLPLLLGSQSTANLVAMETEGWKGRGWCWLPDTFCPTGHQLSLTSNVCAHVCMSMHVISHVISMIVM